MPQTPNHGYNVPNEGEQDWHVPLNENFERYDTDIEIRDEDANRGNYDPKMGAKFLATDTETVYVGDGTSWKELPSTGREPEVDTLTSETTIDVAGVDAEGGTVKAGIVSAEGILAESGLTTPAINANRDVLGIGTDSPSTPLDVRGQNNWNLDNTDGDVRIGDDDYRLAMGVALGGGGAGNAAIRAKGGDALKLGVDDRGGILQVRKHPNQTSDNAVQVPDGTWLSTDGEPKVGRVTDDGIDLWSSSLDVIQGEIYFSFGSPQYVIEKTNASGYTGTSLKIREQENGNRWEFRKDGSFEADGNKNFVQSVDTDDGEKEVVYTATEAATPQTEASGVAELEDGRAEIVLPDHFDWVTDDAEPLVVETTPYSADSGGLAVVERSTEHLVVEDLDGEGDYEFAYTVRGTRDGHADKAVVREPSAESVQDRSAPPADD